MYPSSWNEMKARKEAMDSYLSFWREEFAYIPKNFYDNQYVEFDLGKPFTVFGARVVRIDSVLTLDVYFVQDGNHYEVLLKNVPPKWKKLTREEIKSFAQVELDKQIQEARNAKAQEERQE